ncbi:choice-of-anchor L domain-containing protein [Aliigemmobacter aestuarii]|uniref:choice-of-anchor L domain-containing protein n=1 Tax=Aliigemmobacter aestuarii TaxID=1445661 RepID=UPI001454DDF0|nr:choice-of-anchor L domain-containing protein [Gemmobacter aestuarii]
MATNQTGWALAETMFGEGVTLVSATFSGDPRAAGIYTNGDTVSPDVVPSASGVILSTGYASRFTNATGAENQTDSRSGQMAGVNGDPGMNAIAGVPTYDGAFIDASFIPVGDTLTMRLVFGSEEYLEWVHSGYNDAVGIWVNGVKVELALGDGDISIDNINTGTNANLFRDNSTSTFNTEMDGLTLVLTLKAPVIPGSVNTIRIGIADAGDRIYDSALLIVADSVQTALVAQDDRIGVTAKGETTVDLLANDTTALRTGVQITHLNDIAVKAGQTVALPSGDALRLNANGSVTVLAATAGAGVVFSYTIADAAGTVDTAFVTVTPSPVDGTSGDDAMHVGFFDSQGNTIDGNDGLSEVILAFGGNDKVTSGAGEDDIYGGDGNDFIRAGDANDLIDGGAGNDVLDGQAGDDTMAGGGGDDVYWIDSANDMVIEQSAGGYDKVMSGVSYTLADPLEELWLKEASTAKTGTGNATANKIVGNALANTLQGLDGADTLFGAGGDDRLFGGNGNDNLYAGDGRDLLSGGAGSDKLFGGEDGDSLSGGDGADTLAAGSGGDTLAGEAGNDLLTGGAGSDLLVFTPGSGRDTVKSFDLGIDHISLTDATGASLRAVGSILLLTIDPATSVTFTGVTDAAGWTLDALLV